MAQELSLISLTGTSLKICNLWSFRSSTVHTTMSYSAALIKHRDHLSDLLGKLSCWHQNQALQTSVTVGYC